MRLSDVRELHFITPFANVDSIMRDGILCRHRAKGRSPASIADASIIERRASVTVPGGMRLPKYANLYFDARNAMLSRRRDQWDNIAVVRVDPQILEVDGAVISDRNAAAVTARFFPSPEGLAHLDRDEVYAEWWNTSREAKQRRMAELLVPDLVPSDLLLGVHVRNKSCGQRLMEATAPEHVTVNEYVFFGGAGT